MSICSGAKISVSILYSTQNRKEHSGGEEEGIFNKVDIYFIDF